MAAISSTSRAVGVEGVVGEPRLATPEVGRRTRPAGAGDRAREQAPAERAVGDDADAELAARVEDVALDVAAEQRVLGLEGGDRVHGDGAPDRVGGGFGQAEVTHLAGGDELGHRADGLLDGHVGIGPVQVVQVDVVEAEPGERTVDRRPHVRGSAVDLAHAWLDRAGSQDAELRGDHRVVASRTRSPARRPARSRAGRTRRRCRAW